MPEWLDRALFGILVALAVLFVWACIAGVMGAFSILTAGRRRGRWPRAQQQAMFLHMQEFREWHSTPIL